MPIEPWVRACEKGDVCSVEKMLTEGHVDIDERDIRKGRTPLYIACENGHFQLAVFLLDQGADFDLIASDATHPCYVACARGHVEVVKLLRSRGSSPCISNIANPLCNAAANGRYDVCVYLIETFPEMLDKDAFHPHPLVYACESGSVPIVKLLLGDKVHLLVCDQIRGLSDCPILTAACRTGNLEVVRFLVDIIKRKTKKFPWGFDGFLAACEKGRVEVAKFLYENGADCERRGFYHGCETEFALLNSVCCSLSIDIMDFLIQIGFDLTSAEGGVIANAAAREGKIAPIQFLLEKGLSVNQLALEKEMPPLYHAVLFEHPQVVDFLLEKGADPTIKIEGSTMLHTACGTKNIQIVESLVAFGAKPSALDDQGRSCFHITALEGDVEVLRSLMKTSSKRDLYNKDRNGATPLHLAVNRASGTRIYNPHAVNLVKYMIREQEGDPNEMTSEGKTAWHLALKLSSLVLGKFTNIFFAAGFVPSINTKSLIVKHSQYIAFSKSEHLNSLISFSF
jgi:ankyrin repeat protein